MLLGQLDTLLNGGMPGVQRLECRGDMLVVDFAGSTVHLTNWQFVNKGRGTAKQILTYVEQAVRDGKLVSATVASVVNFRFADHLHRRGWHKMEVRAGCAPDYVISSDILRAAAASDAM